MLFVMGATGRMGGAVMRHADMQVRAGSRLGTLDGSGDTNVVRFDLEDGSSFDDALNGCSALFIMRPPTSTKRAPFDHLMQSAEKVGIRHVVCASVYGAGRSRVLPHRHMEEAVRASGLPHTFLRPADFMQNLADVHATGIRERDEVAIPAGSGRSAFLDVEDVGRATAIILRDPAAHDGRAYDLTGPDALNFTDVATIMSAVLDRTISYRSISIPRFVVRQVRNGRPLSMALVMSALYTVQRFGRAAPVCSDLQRLLGRPGGDLAQYIERERAGFMD